MYIQQDREKQNKTIELAKRKYEHIVSVRTQNFKQKEVIRKVKIRLLCRKLCRFRRKINI